jgi:hypothetical protein
VLARLLPGFRQQRTASPGHSGAGQLDGTGQPGDRGAPGEPTGPDGGSGAPAETGLAIGYRLTFEQRLAWAPDHPRAGKGQYVFEHILVTEQVLGRHLLAHEAVHHRNSVRDDNRPKNLELWTRPQPAGIRVSDAVAWAREILALYTGVSDTSNNAQG